MSETATTAAPQDRTADGGGEGGVERDDHLATLQRVQAEYDNYRRRTRRELAEQLDRGAHQLVERLLPVLDAADRALEHSPDAVGPLHRVLADTLAGEGLERVEPLGAAFDPDEQHAVEHLPAPSEAPGPDASPEGPVVVEVLRPGYRWRGRLVRPALVRVQDAGGREV